MEALMTHTDYKQVRTRQMLHSSAERNQVVPTSQCILALLPKRKLVLLPFPALLQISVLRLRALWIDKCKFENPVSPLTSTLDLRHLMSKTLSCQIYKIRLDIPPTQSC